MEFWHVRDARRLERPVDWDAEFGRSAPLILEIGFGNGDHLVWLAKKYPDRNLVGVEISRPSLRKASSKLKNHNLTNCRAIDGGGPPLLWLNFLPETISELHINFPDPWPKEDHHNRRLINDDFLVLAASRLKPLAKLFVATDHADYQPVVTDCLERSPHFHSRLETTYTLDPGQRFQTKYEEKALREGRIPFYYHWERNETVRPSDKLRAGSGQATNQLFPIPQEHEMPHAILQSQMTIEEIASKFEGFEDKSETVNVRFINLFRDGNRPSLLIDTYINETPYPQRLGLVIHEREPHSFIIQLHELGFPRITDGVHSAVGFLTKWLASQPDTTLQTHNLNNFK